ncbi:hypothetical protein [Pseudomonas sp. Marseille-Q7302]
MKHAPSFADVQSVKRHAKTLKSTYPEKKHGKLLDLAAAELLGVRNYYELNRRFDAVIAQHLDVQDGPNAVAHCRYCDFKFGADLREDRLAHRKFHERFMEVEEATGYRPRTYVQRELLKKEGHARARCDASVEVRVEGLLLVLQAWYDRSFASLIEEGKWRKHPSFGEYVAMLVPDLEESHPDLAPALIERFGRMPGVIPPGQSYCSPK